MTWPFRPETVRDYVAWSLGKNNLSPNSVKVYLPDLKLAYKLRNIPCLFENTFFINSMIKGAKILNFYTNSSNQQNS
jgi:hypothetical protein